MTLCHPTRAVRAALACAVCVSIFAGHCQLNESEPE